MNVFEFEIKYLLGTLKGILLVKELLSVRKFIFIKKDGIHISKEIIIETRRVQKHNKPKKEHFGIFGMLWNLKLREPKDINI